MLKQWRQLSAVPGVAVTAMGIAAFVYALLPPEMTTPLTRGLWIAAICFLAAAEIRAIYKDRAAHDEEMKTVRERSSRESQLHQERFEKTMERFEELRQTSDSRFLAMERLINNPAKGLARKAFELSGSILDFIYARMQNVPPLPGVQVVNLVGGTFEDYLKSTTEYRRMMAYEEDTLKFYTVRYLAQVIAIRNEFAGKGFTDPQLEMLYQDPKESGYIRIVGERIGTLAELIEQRGDAASA